MRERIKKVREALNINVTKFADSLNVSKALISLYEKGDRELSNRTIADICRIYNVNEDWLRTGKGDMFKPKDREEEVAEIAKRLLKAESDDYVAKFVKNLALLDYDDWKELNRIIKKILKEQKDSSN